MTIRDEGKKAIPSKIFFNQIKKNIKILKPGLPDSKVTLQRLVIITSV